MDTNEYLIECPTCRHRCSHAANACPNCGRPEPNITLKERGIDRLTYFFLAIFLITIFIERLKLGEFSFVKIGFMAIEFLIAYAITYIVIFKILLKITKHFLLTVFGLMLSCLGIFLVNNSINGLSRLYDIAGGIFIIVLGIAIIIVARYPDKFK
jgi:hypothetical protein